MRFGALPRLITDRAAPALAARGNPPLTSAQRRAAARAVLSAGTGALAEAARRSAGTVDMIAGIFAELDDAEADAAWLDGVIAEPGGWPTERAAGRPSSPPCTRRT